MKKILIILTILLLCSCTNNQIDDNQDNDTSQTSLDYPEVFPEVIVTGQGSIEGTYLTAINYGDKHYLADFNNKGELIWYDVASENADNNNIKYRSCYRGALRKGVFYFFERIENRTNRYSGAKLVIFDETGKSSEHYLKLDDTEYPIDPHDAVVIDVGHYIIETTIESSNNDLPQHSIIQEVKDGEVLWQFNSEDYPNLLDERYTEGDNNISLFDVGDYMHFNSFEIDPIDNNLLVSYRNQCAILKIDRNNGQLLWKMGGINSDFEIDEQEAFHYQHYVTITYDGHLLLVSNGYMTENAKIMEYEYNEQQKQLKLIHSIELPYEITNYGEVIKLSNSNYLLQRGQSPQLDRLNGFEEIDKNNNIVFSVDFPMEAYTYWVDFIPKY